MNTRIKFIIASLIIMPTFNIMFFASSQAIDATSITEGVTLSDGFVVPSDSQGVNESGLSDEFVQNDLLISSFDTDNLEGISSQVATEIVQVEPLTDGSSLVLLREYNTDDAESFGTTLYERSSLLHVGNNGVVIKSYSLGSTVSAKGMGAVSDSFTDSEYDTNTQYASTARMIKTPSGYFVYYVISNNANTKWGYSFVLDESLDFDSINPRQNFTGIFRDNPIFFHKFNPDTQTYEMSEFALVDTALNDETSLDYQMFNVNVGMSSNILKTLELPTWNDVTYKPFVSGTKTIVSDVYVLPDGSFAGLVRVQSTNITPAYTYHGFTIWNEDGTIKSKYFPGYENEIEIIPNLSNADFLFFEENNNGLKKLNLQTGLITLVKSYPADTDLDFQQYIDSEYNSSYLFYGYVKNFRGLFTGLGTEPGAIVGLMDGNFNILKANVIPTDFPVTLDLKSNGTSNMVAYGNLGENRRFANEPTLSTNSIGGRGWVDKASGLSTITRDDSYIGKISLIDDYAPAIKVGTPVVINKDEVTSYQLLTNNLLESVEVYDSFDLNPNNLENTNLTETEILENFSKRINKSPYRLNENIEWETLGLDTTQVGFNTVKYFITDSSLQTTAASKIVNIIDNNTEIDDSSMLAISASNVQVSLETANNLNASQILSLANAKAWNLNDGTDTTNLITVNAQQLSQINAATSQGVLPLDLTVTQGSVQITRQIKIFIGGNYDVSTDTVVFGSDFIMPLASANTITKQIALENGNISAYHFTTGKQIDFDQIDVNTENVKSATIVGNYKLIVTILGKTTQFSVNLYGPMTVFGTSDAIDAHNIIYTRTEISNLTSLELKSNIIENSNVKAWNTITGDDVVYTVDISSVSQEVGSYSVKFVTANNTIKVINVFVFENPTCDDLNCDSLATTTVIDAVNFELEVAQVYSLTPIKVIQLAKAEAINVSDSTPIKLSVDYSNIKTSPGSYDVLFKTENGLEKTVKAIVGEDLVVAPSIPAIPNEPSEQEEAEIKEELEEEKVESIAISGKDSFFTLEEIDQLKERDDLNEAILQRSNVRAWIVESNQTLSPLVVNSDAIKYNLEQKEPLKIETTYSSEEAIEFIEKNYGENLELETNDNQAIAGVDFGITALEVSELTQEDVISLSNAVAWKLDDMSNVEISSVDYSEIKEKQGVYPVKLSTSAGTSLNINAFVGQVNRPKFTEDGHVIFANDYYMFEESMFSEYETGQHPLSRANGMILDQKTLVEVEGNYFTQNIDTSKPGVYTATVGLDEKRSATVEVTIIANQSKTHRMLRKTVLFIIVTFAVAVGIVYYTKTNKRLN